MLGDETTLRHPDQLHRDEIQSADQACDYSHSFLALASLGALATGIARVWAKDDAGMVRARVMVLLPEARAFA